MSYQEAILAPRLYYPNNQYDVGHLFSFRPRSSYIGYSDMDSSKNGKANSKLDVLQQPANYTGTYLLSLLFFKKHLLTYWSCLCSLICRRDSEIRFHVVCKCSKDFVFIIAILGVSCTTRVYSDEAMAIDPHFSSLFYSVIKGDAMRFVSLNGRRKKFVIAEVDSIISNSKGWFINESPYKLLRLKFKEIGKDTVHLQRENEMFVNKDPANSKNSVVIQFNNLFFDDTILRPHHDTLNVNLTRITDCYSFETSLRLKNPDDVESLYISVPKGLLGFKTLSGEIWVNETRQ